MIIELLTNKAVVNKVRKDKYTIQKEDVKHYSDVFNGIIESKIDINSVKSYCSNDAWKKINVVIKQKKKKTTWVCPLFNSDIGADQNSILCDLFSLASYGLCQIKTKWEILVLRHM